MLQPTNAMIENATKSLANGTYLLQWPGYMSMQVKVNRGSAGTGGTAKRKKKACACKAPSTGAKAPKAPAVSTEVRDAIQQRITDWRFTVKQFLAGYRRSVAPAERDRLRTDLWNASVNLLGSMGVDIRNWSPSGQLIAESDVWWARQADFVGGSMSPLMDALAALTSSAASKLSAGAKKGQVDEQVVTLFLSALLKLMQVEGKLALRHVQPKSTKTDPCRVPKKRTGPEAKCNADWDGIVSCVIRSGGLSTSDPAAAELIHAAGRRKDLPPKLIQKRGKPWGQIAHILTEQGFTAPDQHGRPDEQATLETLVEALRGGPRMARMNLCQAERSLYQEV